MDKISSANHVLNRVLILDGNSVLHRAYYALPDWRNRFGEATAGVYGFLSILLKSIEDLRPTHLAIVFDDPSPTFRHTMYVGYQTNREKNRQVSEDIWGQVEKLKVVFQKIGISVFQLAGFEADDVIGTISTQCSEKSTQVIIITGDRDLMQLVNDHVNLYMSFKGISDMIIVDRDRVRVRLGIWPEQVVDYKALVGDSSDNYPGIPGIGPVTAKKLIEQYGSFENVAKKSGNRKVIDGYESGELSKRLATIKTDVPVTFDIAKCLVPNVSKITEIFNELGYKSLIKRVGVKSTDEDSSRPRLF